MNKGWIGVDLDGTLAYYDKWRGKEHIGVPIPAMMERVRRWLNEGRIVKIFTARISGHNDRSTTEVEEVRSYIEIWLATHGLPKLEITCVKDFGMIELWDDRCVQVEPNTGHPIGQSTRGL